MVAAQEQQQDDKKPVPDKPAADGARPVTAETPAKPAARPKRVITNDDIKSSPYAGFYMYFILIPDRLTVATWIASIKCTFSLSGASRKARIGGG
jgi:hypothetical protein